MFLRIIFYKYDLLTYVLIINISYGYFLKILSIDLYTVRLENDFVADSKSFSIFAELKQRKK